MESSEYLAFNNCQQLFLVSECAYNYLWVCVAIKGIFRLFISSKLFLSHMNLYYYKQMACFTFSQVHYDKNLK